jgi:chemotaxis-related protein WspD
MSLHESSAAARLLDRELPQDYLQEWTSLVSQENQVIERGTQSVLVFRIGPEWLALPTRVFEEVSQQTKPHRVPHHPRGGILNGVVSVRGELLLCIALGTLLGIERPSEETPGASRKTQERLLVCNYNGDRFAFFASEVHGIHRCHLRELREVPSTLAKSALTFTRGMLPLNGRAIGYLDEEAVCRALNKGLA